MTLETIELKSEAVFFDGTREKAIEIRDWIEQAGGRVAVTSNGDATHIDILGKKGAWFLVYNPGWIVRDPISNYKAYSPREFRTYFGHGTWRLNGEINGSST